MKKVKWIFCPVCGGKTRTMIREDTELKKYPLFCPKCKQETLIEAKNLKVTVIKEPAAETQSRWTCENLTDHQLFFHYRTDKITHWIKVSVGNFLYFCRVQNNNRDIFNFSRDMFLLVYGAWIVSILF